MSGDLFHGTATRQHEAMNPGGKYRPYLSYLPVSLPDRTWPDRQILNAPAGGDDPAWAPFDQEKQVDSHSVETLTDV